MGRFQTTSSPFAGSRIPAAAAPSPRLPRNDGQSVVAAVATVGVAVRATTSHPANATGFDDRGGFGDMTPPGAAKSLAGSSYVAASRRLLPRRASDAPPPRSPPLPARLRRERR